jgi:hypothetical protein
MCDPANSDLTHSEMISVITDKVKEVADFVYTEHRLSNKKIADIYMEISGIKFIIEVKAIYRNSLILNAYEKYAVLCDYLIVAAPPSMITNDTVRQPLAWLDSRIARVGLWWVDWTGVIEMRPPARLW